MVAKGERGLEKGLDALIPSEQAPKKVKEGAADVSEDKRQKKLVEITKVEPPKKNLQELVDDIKKWGSEPSIFVQDRKTYYEIINSESEQWWRAAKIAGLKEVPVIICTEQEALEISLIESIYENDINPIEEALAYKRLLTEFHLTQAEVAERISKSTTVISNSVRLLKLDEKVQQMIIDDMITKGQAQPLVGIEDKALQYELAQQIFDEKLNVREVEKLVKSIKSQKPKKSRKR